MFGIERIAPVRMSTPVQEKVLGIQREDLRLHIDVAGGDFGIVRELKNFEASR